jgi:tRNA (guanine9-N1)-methyltransferase
MAEMEESPSKKRKLGSPEPPKNISDEASRLALGEKLNGTEEHQVPLQNDGSGLSNIDIPSAAKEDPPLSKSQLKKRRRQEQWEAAKEFRKDKRRDKRHEKQARKAQERAELQEKIAKGEIEVPKISSEELKRRRPVQVPVTLIIDCDFDELMTEKELISLGAQLTRCYSDNRHSKHRAHMVVSSWNGALRTRFETVLTNHHKSWKGVTFTEKNFVDAGKDMDVVMRGQNGGLLVGAFAPHEADKPVKSNGDEPKKENDAEALPLEVNLYPGQLSAPEESMDVDSVRKLSKSDQPCAEESKEVFTGESTVEKVPKVDGPVTGEPKEESKFEQLPHAPDAKPDPTATVPTPASEPGSSERSKVETTTAHEPSIVYLTSDSPHTLDRLSPYTSYIIGGIVDKNRHKNLCYKRACERGIPTAKLPIGEYMTMQSRSVLATNHVVEIMLKWLDTGDWGEAFLSVIPKRKEARLRVKREGGEEGKVEESGENGKVEESEDEEDDGEIPLEDRE